MAITEKVDFFDFCDRTFWIDDVNRHGGPWDRGSADSYYQRGVNPHYYEGDTRQSKRIEEVDMTEDEILEYKAGYCYNEIILRDFKDWG